jgi:hypothetical protein
VDILVNNAGLERRADFWDVTEEDYDAVMNVNLKGMFFFTQAFVKHRQAVGGGGKIINISSVHEELPFPHFTSYCASKGGVKMLTRNLSIERAAGHYRQFHRARRYRNAHQHETAERSGKTEGAAGQYSAGTPGQAGRCGIDGRFPGVIGVGLRDRNHVFCRRRIALELSGTVGRDDSRHQARISVAVRAASSSLRALS